MDEKDRRALEIMQRRKEMDKRDAQRQQLIDEKRQRASRIESQRRLRRSSDNARDLIYRRGSGTRNRSRASMVNSRGSEVQRMVKQKIANLDHTVKRLRSPNLGRNLAHMKGGVYNHRFRINKKMPSMKNLGKLNFKKVGFKL